MSPLIRQLQDGDKHQRLLRKESRLVVQLTSIRQKQTYYSGSELSWLALRLAEKISGHSLNQSEVNQNNRDSLARECIWHVLFPRFNALTGDSHLTISLFTFSRLGVFFFSHHFSFDFGFLRSLCLILRFVMPHSANKIKENIYLKVSATKHDRSKKNVVIMDKAFARLNKKGWLAEGRNLLEFSKCFKAFTRELVQNLHCSNWPHTCKQNKDEWCYLRVTVPSFLGPLSYVISFCKALVRINVLADFKRKRRSVSRWRVLLGKDKNTS